MDSLLKESELFEGLTDGEISPLETIARHRSLEAGEYLFLLGDNADRLYTVLKGKVEICLPLSFRGTMKDIAVESMDPGRALGWSAFVRPYRFTLSARAAEPTEVVAFVRGEMLRVFDAEPRLGHVFSRRIAEVIGQRLFKMQALWGRELQRTLEERLGPGSGVSQGGSPAQDQNEKHES